MSDWEAATAGGDWHTNRWPDIAEHMARWAGPVEFLDSPPNRRTPPHADGADYELGERYWHAGAWWVIATAERIDGHWKFGARRDTAYLFEPDEWDRAADAAHMSRGQYADELFGRAAPSATYFDSSAMCRIDPPRRWWA